MQRLSDKLMETKLFIEFSITKANFNDQASPANNLLGIGGGVLLLPCWGGVGGVVFATAAAAAVVAIFAAGVEVMFFIWPVSFSQPLGIHHNVIIVN